MNQFPGGVWPVMLTPFTETGAVDFEALEKLTEWYIENGVNGLFAVCQSSEMFSLTLEERLAIARTVVQCADGRVPVIASGHVSDREADQIEEVNRMAETGVKAVILITNRFAAEDEDDEIWLQRCTAFLDKINPDIPLGFYECPYPYKRLISLENLRICSEMNRFYFLKDTCCNLKLIQKRLELLRGTNLKLYNANSATLLDSLRYGASGFSGVMANFHPRLYVYLCNHMHDKEVDYLQDFLGTAALIERQYYPVNAKYHLQKFENLPLTTYCRKLDDRGLTETYQKEIAMLNELTQEIAKHYKENSEKGEKMV